MPQRIVIVGGGAAGMGVTGAAKQANPEAVVTLYTDYEDAAYSPCGIPYVHGKEIPNFERLFLQGKEFYEQSGIDIHYQTTVESSDLARHEVRVVGEGAVGWDRLVIATGFNYAVPEIPGTDLEGLYYPKNIRRAMEWDKVLDTVKTAVVFECGPLGVEMTTALAQRGIETHVVDSRPWALADVADPDIMQPVQDAWAELGVKFHFNTPATAFLGKGKVRAVKTPDGEIPADIVVVCTHKEPEVSLARSAGLRIGSTGGIIVDDRMATSTEGVFAAGDCVEIPHGVTRMPIQGLSGSHAYAQGRVAGANAAGGDRFYQPVAVPWGLAAGPWMVGGVSLGETLAKALGLPFILGAADGISRARYYPDMRKVRVKLLAEPKGQRLIGAQMVGGEGIKERADFLAVAVKTGVTLSDLAWMENVYSPPIGALNEPIALAAQNALNRLKT